MYHMQHPTQSTVARVQDLYNSGKFTLVATKENLKLFNYMVMMMMVVVEYWCYLL